MEFPKFPSPEEIAAGVQDIANNALKAASDLANNASSIAGQAVEAITDTASSTAGAITSTVGGTVANVTNAIDSQIAARNEAEDEKLRKADDLRHALIKELEADNAREMLDALGASPIPVTDGNILKVKNRFPIPKESDVLWIDAEFDLRPSGIIATTKGVFIKSDAVIFALPFTDADSTNTSSMLYFVPWEYFEPESFTEGNENNQALSVDATCAQKFIAACKEVASDEPIVNANYDIQAAYGEHASTDKAAAIGAAAILSDEAAVFPGQKASINNPGGHGEMAEEANTIIDRFLGHQAKVVGCDNAKDGADRIVDGLKIQTKYYNTARGTLESAFDNETGLYRYIDKDSNALMQLEVPKDQYDTVLRNFEKKISENKVPGVKDPAEARNIVRRGHLTHKQAVNLAKPGTVESLTYDAATGTVICSCAFGISFVAAAYNAYRKSGNIPQSIQAGIAAGVQVFGISFIQHILVSQIARTSVANTLMTPSQFLVKKLGCKATQGLVNSLRALSGKNAISGAAASKQLAKIFRSNVITTAITLAVFSIPETYNLVNKKISTAQYAKNMSSLTGSVVGAAGGAIATGAIASKVAGAAGTAIAPGVGTAIGVAGGFLGGAAGSAATNVIGTILHEGDAVMIGRLLNAYVSCMTIEYMLDETELGYLTEELDKITSDEFKELFASFLQSEEQECAFREFLAPRFDSVIARREPFKLPNEESIDDALSEILISLE